ncbi:glycosyltransferase family 1 protein [Novosphingobium flavum]|uniref:Glycosyltransferase family 1 protein n=1 Tax=Novosphingobium aerophilum TaxID=2839843 RepID=A0A7X1F766_9SPHN|nr:glycosyltransferase family 1 protein [Novosphingobium aerophilum]MBC2651631.1 glycosyltransferase family 1 protein [Novosphingobium aerophilum]MBC2661457.1 glycosyltransferase family 1 protein [Novosphingobium aerophilum]
MRIAIATDAWLPQVNGVVRTLAATVAELDLRGHEVELITPARFLTVPMPGYASIDLAVAPRFTARKLLHAFAPDIVHIPTEGPIGWAARSWCLAQGVPFTTAFHTRFPEYAAVRTGLSVERFWPLLRRFHRDSRAVLVATPSLEAELNARGIARTHRWTRGIDHWLFRPDGSRHPALADLPRPILLNVGRVAPEKNLDAFLALDLPGSKVVVGDGPDLAMMRARYPGVHFLGTLEGEDLASAYRAADLFVFPSLTDTFGLVMIEALACGLPVAAFPVTGPSDIIGLKGYGPDGDFPARIGCLDPDLSTAIGRALGCDRKAAAVFARRYTWQAATDQFLSALSGATGSKVPSDSAISALEPA